MVKGLLVMRSESSEQSEITNALTIDVEDYYQVSAFENVINRAQWSNQESRVERNTEKLLELFSQYDGVNEQSIAVAIFGLRQIEPVALYMPQPRAFFRRDLGRRGLGGRTAKQTKLHFLFLVGCIYCLKPNIYARAADTKTSRLLNG